MVVGLYYQNQIVNKELLTSNVITNSEISDINDESIDLKDETLENYSDREELIYQVEECSNSNFRIEDVIVTNKSTKLMMQTDEKPNLPYDENDDEETKNKKIKESIKEMQNETLEDFEARRKFKNEYIENEKGERFYPLNSTSEDSGYSNTEMKYLNYWQTFNMTTQNATNKLTIYVNYKGEDMYIKLKIK